MQQRKWDHSVDQWMEERLWKRVPSHIASPHFFWFLGFICGTVFSFTLIYLIR